MTYREKIHFLSDVSDMAAMTWRVKLSFQLDLAFRVFLVCVSQKISNCIHIKQDMFLDEGNL